MTYNVATCIAVVLVLAEPMVAGQDGNLEIGRTVFRQRCMGCHGESGEGRESIERTFSVDMRHLGSEQVQAMSDEALRMLLLEGGLMAKPVRNLSGQDATNVILFLRSLQLED